jgi:hypothetical protein
MTNFTPSRVGQINGAGGTDALFLKVFPGEVLGAFDETQVMMGLHTVRNIDHGKSAQFPATGKAAAAYHVPGVQLLGTNLINHAEREIFIDSLLTADTFTANIDEAMNHYEVRGEYAKQLGEALANKFDTQLLQVAILAARSAATVTGLSGGSALTHANAKTDGVQLASMFYDAAQTMDEKDIPENDRVGVVKPVQYYLLVQTDKLLNRDFGGSNGVYAEGSIMKAAGIGIVKSNHLPTTVVGVETGVHASNTYNGDFTKTAAGLFHRSAVGTVRLLSLATEKEYQVSRQGTLMVAKYAMGHGILRPESAVELATP